MLKTRVNQDKVWVVICKKMVPRKRAWAASLRNRRRRRGKLGAFGTGCSGPQLADASRRVAARVVQELTIPFVASGGHKSRLQLLTILALRSAQGTSQVKDWGCLVQVGLRAFCQRVDARRPFLRVKKVVIA